MKAFISLSLVWCRWATFLSDPDCLHLERLCLTDWLVQVTIIWIILSLTNTDQGSRGSIFSQYSGFALAGFFMFSGPCQIICGGRSVVQVIEFVTTSFFSKSTTTSSFSTWDVNKFEIVFIKKSLNTMNHWVFF